MPIDEHYWRDVIRGEREGRTADLLRGALRGLSVPYGAAMTVRRKLFAHRWPRPRAAGVPVISVGNITVGGTGKTPLVGWIASHLAGLGRRPAILTRGYRAVDGVSDEAAVLRQATGVPVVVDPSRVRGAATAVAGGADVLVMDDGFQHLWLGRDLNLVTLDALCPFGYDAVVPRGLLREPLAALRDADAFILTRCDLVESAALRAIGERLAALGCDQPVLTSAMRPVAVESLDGRSEPLASLADRGVWAFCGLGHPEAFFRMVQPLVRRVLGREVFNDHHAYSEEDMRLLQRDAHRAGADILLTTGKDAVKLTPPAAGVPLRWLRIDVELGDDNAVLAGLIAGTLAGA
ncbi:MAG: tetraacyldisaccharide 4'-kinase [Planctomycetes bacterium]|nr:tetraacyldisaccharide 4'-kinase [Planctomycetota bacterium]